MNGNVPILTALIAGLISFLSPCVLPLVPPYLVFLTGTSLERFENAEPERRVRRETVLAAALFVLGFSTVFVALGASASVIGSLIRAYSGPLSTIAGVVIIIMGLHFLGITPIALLHRQKRLEVAEPVGLWGAYVIGLAFAFGWTPCIGPILAAILAVAASEQTVTKGAGLLGGLFARPRHSVHDRRFRGRAVRGVSGALQELSAPRRAGDGRAPGAHRHRLPHRQHQLDERLAAGGVSGAGQDRLSG